MTVLRHQLSAACPPEALWAVLSDLTAVAIYNPTVRSAKISSSEPTGVGATRACILTDGSTLIERATVWEDGRALGLEVVKSNWPMHPMSWVTRIEASASGSRVTQVLEYKMKLGPLGAVLNALVLRRKLDANIESTLAAFIQTAEGRWRMGAESPETAGAPAASPIGARGT